MSQYVNDVIIQIQNTRIILVSVYYPIADKAPMQVTLTQQLNNELPKTYPIIMGGDFNHTLNLATDRQTYGCDKQGKTNQDKNHLTCTTITNLLTSLGILPKQNLATNKTHKTIDVLIDSMYHHNSWYRYHDFDKSKYPN